MSYFNGLSLHLPGVTQKNKKKKTSVITARNPANNQTMYLYYYHYTNLPSWSAYKNLLITVKQWQHKHINDNIRGIKKLNGLIILKINKATYILSYLLHGAESFLRS